MRLITVEEHVCDKALGEATKKAMEEMAPFYEGANPPNLAYYTTFEVLGDLGENRLADMAKNGIDMQVLSHTQQTQLLSPDQAIPMCIALNEKLAAAVEAHPEHFAAFAALPWTAPAAAANELKRAVEELGLKGVLLAGRPDKGAVFLDDEQYWPILQMANDLEVPIYMHPGCPLKEVQKPYYSGFDPVVSARVSAFGWGWHNEAGIQILRMILAGIFDRFPKLQLIAGHWGEMVPFFLDRLDEALPVEATHLKHSISETFKSHVFVTPSGMFTQPHFEFILKVLGADRIIFSVDYPFISNEGARKFLNELNLSEMDKEKIAHGNVVKLLKL